MNGGSNQKLMGSRASVLPPRRRRLWQAYIFLFSAAVCRRRRAAAATSAQPLPLLGSDPVITNEGLCVLLTLCLPLLLCIFWLQECGPSCLFPFMW